MATMWMVRGARSDGSPDGFGTPSEAPVNVEFFTDAGV